MKKHILSCALAYVAFAAAPSNAAIIGTVGGGTGTLLTLSSAGLSGGTVATLTGGAVQTSDQPFADIPKGSIFGNTFLAAGPSNNGSATLNFTNPVNYLSFLFGSPDTYNVLTITNQFNVASNFTAAMLGLPGNGDQSFSSYVQFNTTAGDLIKSVTFSNTPNTDAFESANFSINSAVPEPATWALMLFGFGAMGVSLRRRRRTASIMQIA